MPSGVLPKFILSISGGEAPAGPGTPRSANTRRARQRIGTISLSPGARVAGRSYSTGRATILGTESLRPHLPGPEPSPIRPPAGVILDPLPHKGGGEEISECRSH